VRRAIVRALGVLRDRQFVDQLLRHGAHRLPNHARVLIVQHLTNDLAIVILSRGHGRPPIARPLAVVPTSRARSSFPRLAALGRVGLGFVRPARTAGVFSSGVALTPGQRNRSKEEDLRDPEPAGVARD
jgi:hypothetical protein